LIYLLDANTLIDANRDYYGIGQVDEYWDWLIHHGDEGKVKIPLEVYEEVKAGTDVLADWMKDQVTADALRLEEDVDVSLVQQVIEMGYAADLTDIEVEKIGRDPFLIAYALADAGQRTVVTTENSKPSTQRANRKVPDVCDQFSVNCCNAFQFGKTLNFTTRWKDGV
jgi:hypothetical protein